MALGRAIHSSLGQNFAQKVDTREDLPTEGVVALFREAWANEIEQTELRDEEDPQGTGRDRLLRRCDPRVDTWTLPQNSELDVLIACSLPRAHPGLVSRIRSSLLVTIDWKRLLDFAGYHRLRPLLYTRLAEHAADLVPTPHLAEMESAFRAHAVRNLQLTGELLALVRTFAALGIDVLPFKGPLLAQAAYGDLAVRQFTDLDILIHPSDLPRAIAILAGLDYRPADDLAWLSPSALLRWTGEMSYTSPSGVFVDLHWRLTPSHYPVQLDPDILWRHRESTTIAGAALPTLTPEAMLLLLAVHGAKHCWEAIGWLADIAWLLDANPGLNWKPELAAASGCERPLDLAQSLIEEVFYGRPSTDPLCERVFRRWYYGPLDSPRSPELFSFAAALAHRRSDTLKHLAGLLLWPTEIDWKTRRLPEELFWLYTPGRVARLLGKYLG